MQIIKTIICILSVLSICMGTIHTKQNVDDKKHTLCSITEKYMCSMIHFIPL